MSLFRAALAWAALLLVAGAVKAQGVQFAPLPVRDPLLAAAPATNDPADIDSLVEGLVNERFQQDAAKKKQQDEQKKQDDDQLKQKEKDDGYVIGSALGLTGTWRNGFWLETPNKDFMFHFGGTVMYDLATYAPQSSITSGPRSVGPVEDGANLRRARLRSEGTMWELVDFRFELEFANGVTPPGAASGITRQSEQQTFLTPAPTDAWVSVKEIPVVGIVRVGRQKEPFSLENLDSDRWIPFMERAPIYDTFTPTAFNNGRNPGILMTNNALDDRFRWALGGFKNTYNVYGFDVGGGQYAATGRLSFLPYYEDNGLYMLYFGMSGSHRDPVSEQLRFRSRPSVRNQNPFVPTLIDTGFFNSTAQDLIGLEAYANMGSFLIQAEYQGSWNQDSALPGKATVGTTYYQGYYIQALYWLTGERNRWDKKEARPDRPVVNEPFYTAQGPQGWLHGTGGWQIGVRYSFVDTNSKGIDGGMLDDVTVGLNWVLNNNVRFQWNYAWERRFALGAANDGNLNAFGMRVQVDY